MKTTKNTKNTTTTIAWAVGSDVFMCTREHGACPFCLVDAVVALPPPLALAQPDGTTHVCHPVFGGCNHGFRDDRNLGQ